MGIHDFTKVFQHNGEIKFNELKNKTISIDASVELYRSSLGMKNINTLTDKNGNSTIFINVILSNIIRYEKNKINQIWVFDFDPNKSINKEFHNPLKIDELLKRKEKKEKAIKEIKMLKEKSEEDELFSDDDDDEEEENKQSNIDKIHVQEKRCFSINKYMINDLKFILNCLDICWIEAPETYESEHICGCLTQDLYNNMADLVLSTDMDSLIYGAKSVIKKNTRDKKYYLYDLNTILVKNDLTIDDLRKISIILGCDFSPKTPRIGPKTVLKKFKDIELTEKQQDAFKHFSCECPSINNLDWHNKISEIEPYKNLEKINILLDWLEKEKSFNRNRIKKQFAKIIPNLN